MEQNPETICEQIRRLSTGIVAFISSIYIPVDSARQQKLVDLVDSILYDRVKCKELGINYVNPSQEGTIRARAYALHLMENATFW